MVSLTLGTKRMDLVQKWSNLSTSHSFSPVRRYAHIVFYSLPDLVWLKVALASTGEGSGNLLVNIGRDDLKSHPDMHTYFAGTMQHGCEHQLRASDLVLH